MSVLLTVLVIVAWIGFGTLCWRAGIATGDVRARRGMAELPVTPRAPFDIADHVDGLPPAREPRNPWEVRSLQVEQRARALRLVTTMADMETGRVDLPVVIVHAIASVNTSGERDAVLDAIGVLVGGRHQDIPADVPW